MHIWCTRNYEVLRRGTAQLCLRVQCSVLALGGSHAFEEVVNRLSVVEDLEARAITGAA